MLVLVAMGLLFGVQGCRRPSAPAPKPDTAPAAPEPSQPRLRGTLEIASNRATGLKFAPDGRTLALAPVIDLIHPDSGNPTLYDIATGQKRHSLTGHKDGVSALDFSPDGTMLASSSSDGTVKLWSVATGQELHTLGVARDLKGEPPDMVRALVFSPDGKTLASGSGSADGGGRLTLWELASGQQRAVVKEPFAVRWLSYTADGQTLLSAGSSQPGSTLRLQLWDAATAQRRSARELSGHTDGMTAVAFTRDGRTVASGSQDTTVRVWDVATGKQLNVLEQHGATVQQLAFTADGRTLASAGMDGQLILWEVATGKPLYTFRAGFWVDTVTFTADGSLLACGISNPEERASRGSVRIWDVAEITKAKK
jgi:WD40 repeat protein